MEKLRTIQQLRLLKKMRSLIVRDKNFYGMCGVINDLWNTSRINVFEQGILNVFLYDRKPSLSRQYGCGFWWKSGNKKPRLRWIDKEIKKLNLKLKK